MANSSTTKNVAVTCEAAANVLLPAWLAVMVQVPTATSVRLLPLTVQTLVVAGTAKLTGRPEVALATSDCGGLPSVWIPGEVKLMVCAVSAPAATANVFDTCGAAE